jgi:hypothetical protein
MFICIYVYVLCVMQEWVDFYLLGTDGGFLLNARKVLYIHLYIHILRSM